MRERSPTVGVVVGNPVLAALTTLRLGGPAGRLVTAVGEDEVIEAVRAAGETPVLILAGGSNVVIADEGFAGTVVLLRTRGITETRVGDRVTLTVAAGEPWDEVCAAAVAGGYSGIECLSGVPGSAGATPVQNVGAYGQEVAETITAVRVYDRVRGEVVTFAPQQCGFAYRSSAFKHIDRYVVLSVDFTLAVSPWSVPIRYAELARRLGVAVGERAPLGEAREVVLKLRADKGMVLDDTDRDTWSVGSFFTNPIITAAEFAAVRERIAAAGVTGEPPVWPGPDGGFETSVKTSAAWLIERAGYRKGYGGATVSLSSKHTLALTHRGGGTTAQLLDLAREIRDGVAERFCVTLRPEPVLVGCSL